jgi:ferritin-like metal-binding protein YciE
METMINLNDLLKHEIMDLYSVESQIIEAMPGMIEKAKNAELKKALKQHLDVTEGHKTRLDKIKAIFGEPTEGENKGFFSRIFGGGSGEGEKCKGIEGIISEGQKILNADITDEALDAAIIASAQKIEHYEICGYGTARAFARELKMSEVESLLTQTLNEEYEADDKLTALAVGKLNIEAEMANGIAAGDMARDNSKGNRTPRGEKNSNGVKKSRSAQGSKIPPPNSASGNGRSNGKNTGKAGKATGVNSKQAASSNGEKNKKGNSAGNSKNNNAKSGGSKAVNKKASGSNKVKSSNSKNAASKKGRPAATRSVKVTVSKAGKRSSAKGSAKKAKAGRGKR